MLRCERLDVPRFSKLLPKRIRYSHLRLSLEEKAPAERPLLQGFGKFLRCSMIRGHHHPRVLLSSKVAVADELLKYPIGHVIERLATIDPLGVCRASDHHEPPPCPELMRPMCEKTFPIFTGLF